MKSIFDMTGAERAAALLVALGPEIASEILRYLDEDSIEKITVEIARIDRLSIEEKEDLIGEFLIALKKERRSLHAGEKTALDLLEKTFGIDKANEILHKVSARDVRGEFEFLRELEPELLAKLLKEEMPQTIAVAMTYLPPSISAGILRALPSETAKTVALRMARLDSVSPEAVVEIARGLKRRYKTFLQQNVHVRDGGVNSLINIINNMSYDEEKRLLNQLDGVLPDVTKEIRNRIISFENVVNLSNRDMRVLIDEIKDDRLIARALKGAGDDIRFKFIRNMSQNRATDVITEMDSIGSLRLTEVEECRSFIMEIMRNLYDSGEIVFKKDGEIFVE